MTLRNRQGRYKTQRRAPCENGRLPHVMACFLTAVGVLAELWAPLPCCSLHESGVKLFRVARSMDPVLDAVPCSLLKSGAAYGGSCQDFYLSSVFTGHLEAVSALGLMEQFVPRCSILMLSRQNKTNIFIEKITPKTKLIMNCV